MKLLLPLPVFVGEPGFQVACGDVPDVNCTVCWTSCQKTTVWTEEWKCFIRLRENCQTGFYLKPEPCGDPSPNRIPALLCTRSHSNLIKLLARRLLNNHHKIISSFEFWRLEQRHSAVKGWCFLESEPLLSQDTGGFHQCVNLEWTLRGRDLTDKNSGVEHENVPASGLYTNNRFHI